MKQLGKYEIIELLGSGATADVYRAHDESMGRDVALKIFKPALVADATTFARFVQEAQAAAGLFHENIATALDSGEIDGNYYIAMRYAAGQSLDRLLKEGGALPWDEALRMTQQIGRALNYAHEHGFLHRDVKPANIIRSNAGNYVLTDFGLAKAMFSSGVTTHTGAVLGTPSYIPPEIWEGQEASAATDVYALACVLYEALTGGAFFTGATPPAVMSSHFKERHFPAHWPAGVPDGVNALLAKALAVTPQSRISSVAEFTTELTRLGASQKLVVEVTASAVKSEPAKTTAEPVQHPAPQPVQTPPVQKVKTLTPKTQRKKNTWLWILLGLIALAVFVCLTVPVLFTFLTSLMTPAPIDVPTVAPLIVQESQPTQAPVVVPSAAPTPEPTSAPATDASMPPACEGIGQTWVSPLDGMTLVCVPAGKFTMGSNDTPDGQPVHEVYLDAYWMDQTEVTNTLYANCVSAGGCTAPISPASATHADYYMNKQYANYPAINVDWNQAVTYCTWAGRGLPTEAQWEKAARGTDGRIYPWGDAEPGSDRLNYNQIVGDTTEVGSYPSGASPYGAMDMAGNVSEWIADWHDGSYYGQSPQSNPTGADTGEFRVLRGGNWYDRGYMVLTFYRYGNVPDGFYFHDGFRCVLSLP